MSSPAPPVQAIVKTHAGVELAEVARPRLTGDEEVLLEPLRVGLCRTDLHVAAGRIPCAPPRVLGHEVAGIVRAVGDAVTRVRVGDRVTVHPLLACASCPACLNGEPCATPRMLGVDQDGGFAQMMMVPERALFLIPERMAWTRAAYVEPVAATLAVLNSPISPSGRGLVLGGGRIADLTLRVLAAHGFRDVALQPLDSGPLPRACDWVIDTLGSSASLDAAMRALGQGGTLVLKSRPAQPAQLNIAFAVQRELTLHAVRYAPFEDAIKLLDRNDFAVEDLFGETYPLSAFVQVFAQAECSETAKVFFAPNPELG